MPREFEPTLVEYEEDSADSRVYKFDPRAGQPGVWCNLDPACAYRVSGNRLQFYRFRTSAPAADRAMLESFLRGVEPILEKGCLEIWIGKDSEGHFLRDYRFETEGALAAALPELTREAFVRALDRVKDAVDAD